MPNAPAIRAMVTTNSRDVALELGLAARAAYDLCTEYPDELAAIIRQDDYEALACCGPMSIRASRRPRIVTQFARAIAAARDLCAIRGPDALHEYESHLAVAGLLASVVSALN